LVIGVLAQVVLGGIVVLTGLHPLANMGHFALSMVLVANALVLVRRSTRPDEGCTARTVDSSQNLLIRLVVLLGTMAAVTGTVVTGTGPHAGDEEAPRFEFDISHVARIHGITVIATLVACLVLAVTLRRNLLHKAPVTALEGVIAIGFVQAAIGYVQYFNGVPALLVGFHVLGATLFFLALVNLWMSATQIVDNRDNVSRNSVMV
jgi:cytochrome c oxidase assembly protein subunit 15